LPKGGRTNVTRQEPKTDEIRLEIKRLESCLESPIPATGSLAAVIKKRIEYLKELLK
jgi:hypothetical protein